ncbi:hypothetical protein COLU111180_08890 [Cohnella lubricantis]
METDPAAPKESLLNAASETTAPSAPYVDEAWLRIDAAAEASILESDADATAADMAGTETIARDMPVEGMGAAEHSVRELPLASPLASSASNDRAQASSWDPEWIAPLPKAAWFHDFSNPEAGAEASLADAAGPQAEEAQSIPPADAGHPASSPNGVPPIAVPAAISEGMNGVPPEGPPIPAPVEAPVRLPAARRRRRVIRRRSRIAKRRLTRRGQRSARKRNKLGRLRRLKARTIAAKRRSAVSRRRSAAVDNKRKLSARRRNA